MQDDIIILDRLSHSYKTVGNEEIEALTDVSLRIKKGEAIAIIGANGSGKSTLAKHLNALLLPTGGSCTVCGLDVKDAKNTWNIRQQVGMVFQNPDNQIVAALVEEDVAFGPENIGIPSAEIKERVERSLSVVRMQDYRRQAPHMLSGGQKQRVAIAGVLALEPVCMVLDEVTAMLDPIGKKEVLSAVLELNKNKGITVIYITHFMQEAVLFDRVAVMDAGRLVKIGTPQEIFSQVDEITALGLEVPLAAEVSWGLAQKGVKISTVISNEELAAALCQYF